MNSDCGGERASIDHPDFDITLALGALKPAHALYPAAQYCGAVQVIDIGLGLDEVPDPDENVSPDQTIGSEWIVPSPSCWDHKYSRGMVVLLGGAMPGATALAAEAALRAGAGYALLLNDQDAPAPSAIVQKRWSPDALVSVVQGKHRAAILAGPGLARDAAAAEKIEAAIRCHHPLVLDGDALHLIVERHFELFHERRALPGNHAPVILTPHAGEFEALFGAWTGSKIEAARAAAIRSGAIVVFKGPDTVVAHPDGTTNTASGGSPWLSTAGTGDVLAGIIAALVTQGVHFNKVEAAVWLHGEAARRLGPAFIADDLAGMISAVRASL